ncbi:unnamed protein product [Cuscuta epithymum]|uniref:BHLH domain-containing protein n=1 Tax=Cuscuta epithymum TaxID=186058 RepID=A0AAV0BZL4_9ASTE|nr:unnamed protein product [Cuscuta epithymum]
MENIDDCFFDEDYSSELGAGSNEASLPLDDDDIFSILEALDSNSSAPPPRASAYSDFINLLPPTSNETKSASFETTSPRETGGLSSPRNCKRRKTALFEDDQQQPRASHVNVERNRRKQMNEHLSVLRSLMPSVYVKRGDQASIIGGVVDYITELQQIVESLESKKQRKAFNDNLLPSPRTLKPATSILSPRGMGYPISPRGMGYPISPRGVGYPVSPTTPQRPQLSGLSTPNRNSPGAYYLPTSSPSSATLVSPQLPPSPSPAPPPSNELAVNSGSERAQVEVKFSGANVVLKTVSSHIRGQALKIISLLEDLSLEILHVSITAINDHTMLNSFTIKIGIECQLSAEELAQQVQQTFS